MIERWNEMIDMHDRLPYDGRTKEYKVWERLSQSMVYMHDMIVQTEQGYKECIEALEAELKKWKSQQTGRKTKITKEKRNEICQARADGLSLRAVAHKFGVSEATVRRIEKSERTYTPTLSIQ
jgi:transcriptional regulator with XRE-family HTH domain